MEQLPNIKPPRLLLAFFRWFCDPDYCEDIEGDLLEKFYHWVNTLGAQKAKWLFAKEVLLLFRPGIIKNIINQSLYNIFIMKNINWFKLTGLNLFFILLMVLQFLPGPPNTILYSFSIMIQLIGILCLLLVPIGLTWLIIEIKRRKNVINNANHLKWSYQLAIGVPILLIFIFLLWALFIPGMGKKVVAFPVLLCIPTGLLLGIHQVRKWNQHHDNIGDRGPVFILATISTIWVVAIYTLSMIVMFSAMSKISGAIGLSLLPFGLYWIVKKLQKLKGGNEKNWKLAPYYFFTIPLTLLFTLIYLMKPASDYSRNFVIQRSQALITAIEAYKNKVGTYPASLEDLGQTPAPFIMGIEKFQYQKTNDYYYISFTQQAAAFGATEEVLYDKYKQRQLKGAFASYETGYDHWKYYWFD